MQPKALNPGAPRGSGAFPPIALYGALSAPQRTQIFVSSSAGMRSRHIGILSSALDPKLRVPRAVVSSLKVPVFPLRIVIHGSNEVERRLELDVVKTRFGSE